MMTKIQTCEFIPVSQIIPPKLSKWFWDLVSEDAPFSWGDNNRSLVTASSFANFCQERLDDSLKSKKILDKFRELGEMYIDLEN